MKISISKMLFACGIAALALPTTGGAKPKKRAKVVAAIAGPAASPAASTTAPPAPARLPGYAIIELENGKKDKLRVTEGEARATIPNIMANDVDFITVVGTYTIVTVYQDANFRGHSLTLRCGNYELLEQPRNDVESIRVTTAKKPVSECQGSDMDLVQYKSWDR